MAKNKQKTSQRNVTQPVTPDPKRIEVNLANAPLITVKFLELINNNLVAILAYLKHKDMESGK